MGIHSACNQEHHFIENHQTERRVLGGVKATKARFGYPLIYISEKVLHYRTMSKIYLYSTYRQMRKGIGGQSINSGITNCILGETIRIISMKVTGLMAQCCTG